MPLFRATARIRATIMVSGMPMITKYPVLTIDLMNCGLPKRSVYWSIPTNPTASGVVTSRLVKSVNDIRNDDTSGNNMKTPKTSTNGSANIQAMRVCRRLWERRWWRPWSATDADRRRLRLKLFECLGRILTGLDDLLDLSIGRGT